MTGPPGDPTADLSRRWVHRANVAAAVVFGVGSLVLLGLVLLGPPEERGLNTRSLLLGCLALTLAVASLRRERRRRGGR